MLSVVIIILSGDAVNIHSDESLCVLPAGGGDHPTHLAGGAPPRQISYIRHDISVIKVS